MDAGLTGSTAGSAERSKKEILSASARIIVIAVCAPFLLLLHLKIASISIHEVQVHQPEDSGRRITDAAHDEAEERLRDGQEQERKDGTRPCVRHPRPRPTANSNPFSTCSPLPPHTHMDRITHYLLFPSCSRRAAGRRISRSCCWCRTDVRLVQSRVMDRHAVSHHQQEQQVETNGKEGGRGAGQSNESQKPSPSSQHH